MSSPKKFKALITDIDGTLMPKQRDTVPSKKVIESINLAKKKIHIGVATSRPYYLVKRVLESLAIFGPSIISGGAEIIDAKSGKTLWSKTILMPDVVEVAKIIYPSKEPFLIQHVGQSEDILYTPDYVPSEQVIEMAVIGLAEQQARALRKKLVKIPTIGAHIVPSWEDDKTDVVITHAEATKQHGIFEVAKILGIDTKEIIGVGDGYNDFPLLMACGLKVAMGNAIPELKEIADYIAPSVDQDGLVDVIEHFVLN